MDDRDSIIDRDIQAALDVEPSPDFFARVRTAVANDAEGVSSWQWWTLAAAAACAAVIIGAALVMPGLKPGPTTELAKVMSGPEPGSSPASSSNAPVPTLEKPTIPTEQPRAQQPRIVTLRARALARAIEPPVIVHPDEGRALRAWIARLHKASFVIADDGVITATEPSTDRPVIPEIAIDPLAIQPLVTTVPDKGEPQ